MSRTVVALLALIVLGAILVIAPGAASQNATAQNTTAHNVTAQNATVQNTTAQNITVSPVMMLGSSTMFSIKDANQTEINYSDYDYIYGTSVHVSVITAQLYLNGVPYRMGNIPITFTSDNDAVAVLEPRDRTRPSDANGSAKILLIANNTVGIVNITASIDPYHGLFPGQSDTCTVRVVGWGTVSGMVTDKNQNGVPYAKMTLWYWNGTANTGIAWAPDNPQLTNDGSTAAPGTYTFVYVPAGVYNLTAEKDNHMYFAMVYLTVGTYTANVAFPDYVYTARIAPSITPTPAPTATPATSPTPTPTPTPSSPGFELALVVVAIGLVLLVRRK